MDLGGSISERNAAKPEGLELRMLLDRESRSSPAVDGERPRLSFWAIYGGISSSFARVQSGNKHLSRLVRGEAVWLLVIKEQRSKEAQEARRND